MRKSDFISQLAKQLNKTKKETTMIVNEFSKAVTIALKRGDEVGLGIGKFQLKMRSARMGVNPSTGQKIHVAPKVVPAFRPSKKFKTSILE
ncbi:MAG: HU family DNA-binding protein [Firmicutes bacterium]|nr:HU family DNA-binding protein [Bacillota bacterium]